jgi:TonB family protein
MFLKVALVVSMSLFASLVFATEPPAPVLANHTLDPAKINSPDLSSVDHAPKFVSGKAPVYPISMLLSGKGGSCVIEFTVGIDGKAKEFKVLSPPNKLADHAIIAVKSWVFEPATKDGVPVEARLKQSFSYSTR